MFDSVPIYTAFGSKSEAEPLERVLEMMRSIDQRRGVYGPIFLAESAKEQHDELR